MPRYYADITQVKLRPDYPPRWGRVPTLKEYWDRQVPRLMKQFPRLYGDHIAALIQRRVQESIAKGQGLPE